MTIVEAKKLIPVIQAFADGKDVETKTGSGWVNMENMSFAGKPKAYRIKPESKYRPFENAEECWQEMLKHQPFGWIKNGGYWYNIITTGVMSVKIIDTRGAITTLYFSDLLAHYRFSDGTPFGVKTEEG